MTTKIPARRLTVDHHGLHVAVRRGHRLSAGLLTDTLIGPDDVVDLWIDGSGVRTPGSTPVELHVPTASTCPAPI